MNGKTRREEGEQCSPLSAAPKSKSARAGRTHHKWDVSKACSGTIDTRKSWSGAPLCEGTGILCIFKTTNKEKMVWISPSHKYHIGGGGDRHVIGKKWPCAPPLSKLNWTSTQNGEEREGSLMGHYSWNLIWAREMGSLSLTLPIRISLCSLALFRSQLPPLNIF